MPKTETGYLDTLEEIQLELDLQRELKRVASLLVDSLTYSLLAAQGMQAGAEKQERTLEMKLAAARLAAATRPTLTLNDGGAVS